MSTMSKEVKKQAVVNLLKKYKGEWFYGNDSYYYYLIKNYEFLKCDGNSILDKYTISNIESFELIPKSYFLDELNVILSKALLVGVYKRIRMYKSPIDKINIMEGI